MSVLHDFIFSTLALKTDITDFARRSKDEIE